MSTLSFEQYLLLNQQRVERALEHLLPAATEPAIKLKQAMRYSVQNGGKRVRATLVYASAEAIGCCSDDTCKQRDNLDLVACALECIHAYSLIHDDLPAMDDDDLRRGKPTCHIAFGEATAILAGDALQTFAFELLCQATLAAETRLELVHTLARASGAAGMVGGQQLDLEGENQQLTLGALERIHRLKTGALIAASVRSGALVAGASPAQLSQLEHYARAIGLAFQVTDDILDVESDTATLGKTAGADQALHKSTYPALLGLDGAKQKARDLHQQALAHLVGLKQTDTLAQLATFIVERKR